MSWRYMLPSRLESSSLDYTTGRMLPRGLHYSMGPSRSISSLRGTMGSSIHDVDCDEVYPGIYIGDAAAAKSKSYLKMMGITHVLNAAEGYSYGQVDTGHSYYRDMPGIRYMGFQMVDLPTTDISRYFYVAAKFIDSAITSGGKVLVHCFVGMSRSATCVLAYLMINRRMSASEALRTVRMRRAVRPNEGFMQQLADLDVDIRRKNLYPFSR